MADSHAISFSEFINDEIDRLRRAQNGDDFVPIRREGHAGDLASRMAWRHVYGSAAAPGGYPLKIWEFEEAVGYKIKTLVKHIERQFLKGMSWEKRCRRWHIDHIISLKHFGFPDTADEAFKLAWALPNLRPMWARDNMAKGARRTLLL